MDPAERLKRRKQFAMVGGLMPAMLFTLLGSTIAFGTANQTLSALMGRGDVLPERFRPAAGGIGAGIGWVIGSRD